MPKLIGTAPNQVPTNGSLGNMAFQNKEGVVTDLLSTTALTVTGAGIMSVGGTQIYKDASGNVGIGTSSPATKVDVSASGGMLRVGGASGNNLIQSYTSGGTTAIGLWSGGIPRLYSTGDMYFSVGATVGTGAPSAYADAMMITSAGNVGISNTTPRALLHVGTSASLTDIPVPAGNFAIVRGGGYNGATTAGIQLSGGYGDAGRVAAWQIKSVGSGSGSNFVNNLLFTTQNGFSGSENERMRIDSSGNVGIGTSAPNYKLDVNGTSYFSDNMLLSRTNTAGSISGITITNAGTSASYAGLNINSGTVSSQFFNDAAGNAVVAGAILRTTSNHPLVIGTNNTERMRIDSSGNVGINQPPNASQGRVQISQPLGSSADGALRLTDNATTSFIFNNISSGLSALWSSGALAFGTASGTFTERMRIDSSGNLLVGATSGGQRLVLKGGDTNTAMYLENGATSVGYIGAAKGYNAGFSGTDLIIGGYSNNTIFANSATERMRIDSSGNLLVGTTSSSGSASNTARVIGGIFSTLRSSASVANNTATTIATLPSGEGNYMVSASLNASATPADYNEVAMVCVSQSNTSITTLVNASQLSLSMSGLNLQVTHLQGLTQTIQYSVLRIL
jgi:hypothetical protein